MLGSLRNFSEQFLLHNTSRGFFCKTSTHFLSFFKFLLNPNLSGGKGIILSPSPHPHPICWIFFLNNSAGFETFAAFNNIRDILTKFRIPNLTQSPDIRKNSHGGITDFQISSHSFIKENCHKSRNSNDIDMKLGQITKLDTRNKTPSKNLRWRNTGKLWRHCHFPYLWPIWTNPKARFRIYSL